MQRIILLILFTSTLFAAPPCSVPQAQQLALAYHGSDEFVQDCKRLVDDAISYLTTHEHEFGANKTIIFDVDDTLLSNLEQVARNNFCGRCGIFHFKDWATQAAIPAIPHMKRLYDYCVINSYHIIMLTYRSVSLHDATRKNLAVHGYTRFDHMILYPSDDHSIESAVYKLDARRKLTLQGLEIVACVGDQATDFEGGYTGYQVRVPNYLYGVT